MKRTRVFSSTIFRAIRDYKKPIVLGFFLGVSLALGTFLVSEVVGNEKKPMTQVNDPIITGIQDLEDKTQQPITRESDPISSGSAPDPSNVVHEFKESRFTVLLVGVDHRIGEPSLGNTDTLLVASVNTRNGKIALLSIPRDTQIKIPGHGQNKINAAARLGNGLKTTTALIEGLIGQTIDGYVLTNFSGFKSIIDTLGGITLNVEKNMYYVTGDSTDGIINLKKGTQRLNGAQALQYARFRNDAFADISRTSRQQAVLKAIGKEFMQMKTISKLPWLIPQMSKCVETNLSVNKLWSLTNIFLRNETPEISSQTLPGAFLTENDISYWKVNPLESRGVVKKLFEEGKTTSVFFK
ncbi:MAG: LCP family protein [Bacillota bacterium]|nr:LCP family protein [Bacillota bacterium]